MVEINGKDYDLAGSTVTGMLSELSLEEQLIVVEVNQNILGQDAFASHVLSDGDKVEIVRFVGGG